MSIAEADRCAATMAGATSGDLGEVAAVRREDASPMLAASVCSAFIGCGGQSDCIVAR
ncbi:hypothetical protein U1707_07225 [Sphingomonas sp. PB2P12]|uniref:hypothetical protein n=1 Tax=Sphingomonas sandaracina TaxID=3096157 RepID=UPI002FC9558A